MGVDRKLLQQALSGADASSLRDLQQAQSISDMALDSENFGGGKARGIGLAAQLGTAAIGAYSKYKIEKSIAEKELASQQAFATKYPQFADLSSQLSPATRDAYNLEVLKSDIASKEPLNQLKTQQEQLNLEKTRAEIGKLNREGRGTSQGNAPSGYTFKPDGTLSAIKGGPADKEAQPLTQETAKTLGLAENGLALTSQIKNQFFDAKSGKFNQSQFGKVSGTSLLPDVLIGEESQKFSTRSENLKDTIGRMRSGGAINKDEEKRFNKLIPKFGDKEETVKYKINQLEKEFGSVRNSIKPSKSQSGFEILSIRDE